MELKKFERLLKFNNGIRITDDYMLFNDLELYCFSKDTEIQFSSIEEAYNHKIDDKSIRDIILETDDFKLTYDGGRGSSSSGKMGGGFNHARDGRGKGGITDLKYPAEFNVGGKNRSYEQTLQRFINKYGNSDIEYGITIDQQGFVSRHIQGTSTSVGIAGSKGEMVVHNHPGGGNFSDSDLISSASGRDRGIVATSSKGTYTFTKSSNFKAKEFVKAVKKAQWPAKYNYDKGADWWLKKNAKTYGYKYSFSK